LGELFTGNNRVFPLQFINDLEKFVGSLLVGASLAEVLAPGAAAAQADDEIFVGQPESTQYVNNQSNDFCIGP
jgi:hypothetical protein